MKEVERLPLRDFTRYCMSIAQVPSSYLAGLTIEEQLLWLCSFLTNQVIPTVNNNGQAVEELQELYRLLKDYVDNYFDNLDIQEEVNTKLEEMAESGELADLIAQYLEAQAIIGFNNNASLAEATNLANGSFAKTYGKITYNDGKGALYKIRTRLNSDDPDGDTLITLSNTENLVAEMIPYSRTYDLQQQITTNDEKFEALKIQGVIDPLWEPFYIDGINGDDENNNGKSEAAPFKTLDPVIEQIKKGNLVPAIYFAGQQSYDLSKFTAINAMTIHFVTYGPNGNVILNFGHPDSAVSIYNSHINISGNPTHQVIITGCSTIYWDGGTALCDYTEFDTLLTLWGANIDIQEGCTFKGVKLRGSTFFGEQEANYGSIDIENSKFFAYSPKFKTTSDYNRGDSSTTFFRIVNSMFRFTGSVEINVDNNSYTKLADCNGGIMIITSNLNQAGEDPTPFTTASTISFSQIMVTSARWNRFKQTAGSVTGQSNMVMDNNTFVTF